LATAIEVLRQHNPMTVRQVYYQLVSRQVIENNRGQYNAVSNVLRDARREAIIPWAWIEDRLRRPRRVSMWSNLRDFGQSVRHSYRRDVWSSQPRYAEVWLEKDALSGVFEDILRDYGVTLNVGRGYDGWDSIHKAADRFAPKSQVTVLDCGDFDPSGEDMVRSLRQRLAELGSEPEVRKCALTFEDVGRYNLPPDFTKTTDTRRSGFVARYGDLAVELDALPLDVLQGRLREEIESCVDLAALDAVRAAEAADLERLDGLLATFE
jgi:hypothetical protein